MGISVNSRPSSAHANAAVSVRMPPPTSRTCSCWENCLRKLTIRAILSRDLDRSSSFKTSALSVFFIFHRFATFWSIMKMLSPRSGISSADNMW